MSFATGHVVVQSVPTNVIYGSSTETVVPSTMTSPVSTDPTLTPSTEAEKQAVRDALKSVREKKSMPNNPLPPPIPGLNPKLDVPPPPPAGLSAQAKVTIRVPENAKLWVDDVACPLEGEVRTFNVPNLQPGLEYAYTVRIEVERDGRMASEQRQVQFAAGKNVEIDFASGGSLTARR
ncbi:MAG: TIGR03000 domain-containing protein [Gemmataceae bacterium]